MTPETIRAIRKAKGWSQPQMAAVLRIKDIRTIQRWEKGTVPISGPASIVMELIEAEHLRRFGGIMDINDPQKYCMPKTPFTAAMSKLEHPDG